ncbi:MAG: hypothetical protein WDZ82_01485 [Candidatus Paceibacterota bacterium]
MNKNKLHLGTGLIWGAVLIGTSLLTEAEPGRMLDWELMWVIVGGFLLQSLLINVYFKK